MQMLANSSLGFVTGLKYFPAFAKLDFSIRKVGEISPGNPSDRVNRQSEFLRPIITNAVDLPAVNKQMVNPASWRPPRHAG